MNEPSRLSITQFTTFHWSLPDLVAYARDFGYPAIGLWLPRVTEFGEERSIDLILESGLEVSSLGPVGGFTGSHGHSLHDAILDTVDSLELAARLGANSLTVLTGPRAGHTHNHARRLVRTALLDLADHAADLRVDLALKPMHTIFSDSWTFLHSLQETINLVEECDHSAIKIALGTWHLWDQMEEDLATLARIAPLIASVQLSDSPIAPEHEWDQHILGEGKIPLDAIVQTLIDAEYVGDFEIDIWSRELWNSNYHDLLTRCREEFSRMATVRR